MRLTLASFFFLGKQEIRWYCHASMSLFRYLLPVFACVSVFVLGACQSVSPADRIGQNPVMFSSLTPEQRVLVQQGRICEGMSRDAVYLAWGNPGTAPVVGQENGVSYEKWIYMEYRPVMVDTVGIAAGCGYHGPWCGGTGMTSTAMIPTERAWVMFQNNIVTAWESRR